jgi:hypothetical protein
VFYEWGDNLNGLGAFAPTYPGDPGRGIDLGGRLIGKGGVILPAPPANCPADYRAKYIRVFGVDPGCTPLVPGPVSVPTGLPASPGTNAGPGPSPVIPIVETPPYVPPIGPAPPSPAPMPVSPIVPVATAPPARHRRPHDRVRPGGGGGEICPSYGHVNRQIPGVDEYQVVACTPGQPVHIDRGLKRVVRQEALARHPGGGRERQGQAGDYRGKSRNGGAADAAGSIGISTGTSSSSGTGMMGNSICLPTWGILAAVAAFFFLRK